MRFLSFILAAVLLAMLPGCSRAPSKPVLARVGDHEITVEDFQKELDYRQRNQKPLPDKAALLEEMVVRELMLQKARVSGLENDRDMRRSFEEMLISKVKEHELVPRVDGAIVPPEVVHAVYDKNIARYTQPAKGRLAMIHITTEKKTSEKKLAEAEARITEARQQALALPSLTKGFGRVAMDYSEDQSSRYRGGDIGWFDAGQAEYRWPDAVINAGLAQKPGEVSEIIKAANGFYLVCKTDSRPSTVTPFEQVRVSIQRKLLSEKQQQAQVDYQHELRAAAKVTTDAQALAGVAYPTQTIAKTEQPPPPAMPLTQ